MSAQFERCPNSCCRKWFSVTEIRKESPVCTGVFGGRLPEPIVCPHCGETARQARTSGWWDTEALSEAEHEITNQAVVGVG